ncbi:helix-turn-helix transcriptional regulator [Mycolicibacterium goodii]|uniref:LuxR family transcriptional regulator n=1 Tax=Mycolicibacterium goodii TaxID=134601 RepID=A0A0K0XAX6_MYCGD|nr:LuxR family transcriptional regulator [Mycolicibacterium goodii]
MRLAWPLTGRHEETRLIDAALTSADLAGIVIHGVAGVGKSRIAREALAAMAAAGHETRWVVGTSVAGGLPLGAFARWVGTADADTGALVGRVIDAMTSGSTADRPAVIAVDDAHHLDDLSAFVLRQIVARRAAKLLLTVRDGSAVPDAVQGVWRSGGFERLDLQPCSRAESTHLLIAALGGPVDPGAAERLWRLTRGNILYLRNIVEQEVTHGRLTRRHGYWRWTGDPVLPPGLVELIEDRIGALPTAVGEVVDILAVAEPMPLRTLTTITEPAAVDEAERRGLITLDALDTGVEVRAAHPLYAEIRRNRALATRLRRLRGLVASELARGGDRDEMRVVVRRAALTLESDLPADPDLLTRAAQGAVALADLELAERLAAAAVRAGGGPESNFVQAHALSWLSRGEQSDAVLAAVDASGLTDAGRARLAFLRACNRLWALADPEGARSIVAAAAADTPAHTRQCLDAFDVVYGAAVGVPDTAATAADRLDTAALPAVVGAVTEWAAATSAGDAGRLDDAVRAAENGYRIAEGGFDAAHVRFVIADAHIGALMLAGEIAHAVHEAERQYAYAAELPGAAQLFGTAVAGRAALAAGRLDVACEKLGTVADLMRAAGDTNGFAYRFSLPQATALAMRGSADAATLVGIDERRHPGWRYLHYEHALVHAWVAAAQGAVSEAAEHALAAADVAADHGQWAAEVLCRQTAAQFGDASGAQRLQELSAHVDGPRAAAAAAFANALRREDADALGEVSTELERIGDLVAAADAAAHASMVHRRKNRRGSALGLAHRAEALAERCGGAATPTVLACAEHLPLTDREREIVALLAAGVSSRAVAQRLRLSVRTVEGHVYRAMSKTGAGSRAELIDLVKRQHRRFE